MLETFHNNNNGNTYHYSIFLDMIAYIEQKEGGNVSYIFLRTKGYITSSEDKSVLLQKMEELKRQEIETI